MKCQYLLSLKKMSSAAVVILTLRVKQYSAEDLIKPTGRNTIISHIAKRDKK